MKRLFAIMILVFIAIITTAKEPKECSIKKNYVELMKNIMMYQSNNVDFMIHLYQLSKDNNKTAFESMLVRGMLNHVKVLKINIDEFENVKKMEEQIKKMKKVLQELQLELKLAYTK